MIQHRHIQQFHHISGRDGTVHTEGDMLAGELIDYVADCELFSLIVESQTGNLTPTHPQEMLLVRLVESADE